MIKYQFMFIILYAISKWNRVRPGGFSGHVKLNWIALLDKFVWSGENRYLLLGLLLCTSWKKIKMYTTITYPASNNMSIRCVSLDIECEDSVCIARRRRLRPRRKTSKWYQSNDDDVSSFLHASVNSVKKFFSARPCVHSLSNIYVCVRGGLRISIAALHGMWGRACYVFRCWFALRCRHLML